MTSISLPIPYVAQFNDDSCGAAAFEMVYRFLEPSNNSFTQHAMYGQLGEIEPEKKVYKRITTDGIVAHAQSLGLHAEWGRIGWDLQEIEDQIRHLIDNGVPPIICQRFTDKQHLIGHFRVIVGIEPGFVHLHDPHPKIGGEDLVWPIDRLKHYWYTTGQNVTGGVTIIVSKNKIPHTLTPPDDESEWQKWKWAPPPPQAAP